MIDPNRDGFLQAIPRGLENDPEVVKGLAAAQARVYSLNERSRPGRCAVCGCIGGLTDEHTPSRKANNPDKGTTYTLSPERLRSGSLAWNEQLFRGGVKRKTLCGPCNNNTGGWYNEEYVRFVRACEPLATQQNVGKSLEFRGRLYVARIVKQALSTILASSANAFADDYPELRRLLTDKSAKGVPKDLHLWLSLCSTAGIVSTTDFAGEYDLSLRHAIVFVEFTSWPFSWKLATGPSGQPPGPDVIGWLDRGYKEQVDVELALPCSPVGILR